MNTELKTCNKCKEPRLLTCFKPRTTSPDGYDHSCRECARKYAIEYKRKRKEKREKVFALNLPKKDKINVV